MIQVVLCVFFLHIFAVSGVSAVTKEQYAALDELPIAAAQPLMENNGHFYTDDKHRSYFNDHKTTLPSGGASQEDVDVLAARVHKYLNNGQNRWSHNPTWPNMGTALHIESASEQNNRLFLASTPKADVRRESWELPADSESEKLAQIREDIPGGLTNKNHAEHFVLSRAKESLRADIKAGKFPAGEYFQDPETMMKLHDGSRLGVYGTKRGDVSNHATLTLCDGCERMLDEANVNFQSRAEWRMKQRAEKQAKIEAEWEKAEAAQKVKDDAEASAKIQAEPSIQGGTQKRKGSPKESHSKQPKIDSSPEEYEVDSPTPSQIYELCKRADSYFNGETDKQSALRKRKVGCKARQNGTSEKVPNPVPTSSRKLSTAVNGSKDVATVPRKSGDKHPRLVGKASDRPENPASTQPKTTNHQKQTLKPSLRTRPETNTAGYDKTRTTNPKSKPRKLNKTKHGRSGGKSKQSLTKLDGRLPNRAQTQGHKKGNTQLKVKPNNGPQSDPTARVGQQRDAQKDAGKIPSGFVPNKSMNWSVGKGMRKFITNLINQFAEGRKPRMIGKKIEKAPNKLAGNQTILTKVKQNTKSAAQNILPNRFFQKKFVIHKPVLNKSLPTKTGPNKDIQNKKPSTTPQQAVHPIQSINKAAPKPVTSLAAMRSRPRGR